MRRRTLALVTAAVAVSLIAVASAWAGNGGIAPPDSVTSSGSAINQLYWLVIGITAAVFILVEGALILFIVRYRRRKGSPDSEGPQIHGNTRLELIWTAIPALLLAVILVVTIIKVPAVNAEEGRERRSARHRCRTVTSSTGSTRTRTVSCRSTPSACPSTARCGSSSTPSDVIHSWWVPQITGKRDAIPGKTNTLDFTPLDVGTYRGQCAELCGVQHAVMYTSVEVIDQQEFDKWLAAQAVGQSDLTSDAALALGQQTWEGACAKCHGLDGKGSYGPEIANNSLLADREGLSRLLNNGQDGANLPGYMPGVGRGWPDFQLDALIAYLQQANLAPAPAAGQGGG